jgi:hypothetical protein
LNELIDFSYLAQNRPPKEPIEFTIERAPPKILEPLEITDENEFPILVLPIGDFPN